MRLSFPVAVAALIGILLGIGAVMALREASLSTHHHVGRDSEAVVELTASAKGAEPGQSLEEMVEAVLLLCRLEVGNSDLVTSGAHGDGRFTALYRPGLDRTNRRQLRGCLEDWTVDHLRIDVHSVVTR